MNARTRATYSYMHFYMQHFVETFSCTDKQINIRSPNKSKKWGCMILPKVSYLEKIDGNVAKIHREFEKESSRKLPRLEEEEKRKQKNT